MISSFLSSYPTFLVFLGFVVAAAITMILMPAWIKLLTRTHIGQQVRADGPQSHLVKQGTPTMGGVIMLIAILVTVLLVVPPSFGFVAAILRRPNHAAYDRKTQVEFISLEIEYSRNTRKWAARREMVRVSQAPSRHGAKAQMATMRCRARR